MNTAWFGEYLESNSWSNEDFSRYGIQNDELMIAWWLCSDLQTSEWIDEVLEKIEMASQGSESEFWCNKCRTFFKKESVVITVPMDNLETKFPISLIKSIVTEWSNAVRAKQL